MRLRYINQGNARRAKIRNFWIYKRDTDPYPYDLIKIQCGKKQTKLNPQGPLAYRDDWDHEVEIMVSPTGKSVQVHVNGKKVFP